MNKHRTYLVFISALIVLGLSACTAAKFEARLEANPQCKDVINPKTGALMPCPGSDRAFYVAAGLEAPKPAKAKTVAEVTPESSASTNTAVVGSTPSSSNSSTPPAAKQTTSDCKPKIHKKTGGMLPCPAED